MEYKYALGIPNQGFHTHVFGFALFDLLLTILISFGLMLYTKKYFVNISHSLLFSIILLILVIIAEYLHYKVGLTKN